MDIITPQDLIAECHLLAACLIDDGYTLTRAQAAGVDERCFTDSRNRHLWLLFRSLHGQKLGPSYETAVPEAARPDLAVLTGGVPYLNEITTGIITTTHAEPMINRLIDSRRNRAILGAAEEIRAKFTERTIDSEAVASFASNAMNAAASSAVGAEQSFQDTGAAYIDEIRQLYETGKRPSQGATISWGLPNIDRICGALRPAELVVLAGRPSTGKSALADRTAWLASTSGKNVMLFTYEMTRREKFVRIAQQTSGLNDTDLDSAPRDTIAKHLAAAEAVRRNKNLHVFERDRSLARLVGRVKSFSSTKRVDLIIVDYLQQFAGLETTDGQERTDQKIGRVATALRMLAIDLNCPVVVLASLNRSNDKENRPPRMSDLRESGSIESDADTIAMLHWPTETPHGTQDTVTTDPLYVEFEQVKGRAKGWHRAALMFNRKATRFDDYSPLNRKP